MMDMPDITKTVAGFGFKIRTEFLLTAVVIDNLDTSYSETSRSTVFLVMPNGGVRRMQRHGLKADGVYGIDYSAYR